MGWDISPSSPAVLRVMQLHEESRLKYDDRNPALTPGCVGLESSIGSLPTFWPRPVRRPCVARIPPPLHAPRQARSHMLRVRPTPSQTGPTPTRPLPSESRLQPQVEVRRL